MKGEFDSKDNIVLGHEVSGIIVDISEKYVHLKIGDRVAVNPNKYVSRIVRNKLVNLIFNFCAGVVVYAFRAKDIEQIFV